MNRYITIIISQGVPEAKMAAAAGSVGLSNSEGKKKKKKNTPPRGSAGLSGPPGGYLFYFILFY
jgi:hypothetical protein